MAKGANSRHKAQLLQNRKHMCNLEDLQKCHFPKPKPLGSPRAAVWTCWLWAISSVEISRAAAMSASCHLWPSFASIATDLPLIILGSEHSLFLKGKWQQAWHWLSGLVLWNTLNYYRDLFCWISVLRWKDFMYFQHGNRGPHLPPNKSAPIY